MSEDLSKQERLVDKYVQEKNSEAAVQLLFDLIVRYARKRDFVKAESLRERLSEVDSMALSEIVRAGEIIQEAQNRAIDRRHLQIWADLYSRLTTEERNALYFSLKEETYGPDQFVFKQGQHNSKLYFVGEGNLSLIYHQAGSLVLLRAMKTGDIAGEDTCFSNTVCTTSLTTLTPSIMYALDRAALARIGKLAPALESKLCHYCEGLERIHDLLGKKGLDRRNQDRARLAGRGVLQLLDASGRALGQAFKARLSDISPGGLSVFYRISRKETAQLLLGRQMNVKLYDPVGRKKLLDGNGTVVAVRSQPFEAYSIHIKFGSALDKMKLEAIFGS